MAGKITSGRLTLGTVASRVNGISVNPINITVHNIDTLDKCYLGDENVTTSTGLPLDKSGEFTITLYQGNTLWGVSGKEGHHIAWIAQEL